MLGKLIRWKKETFFTFLDLEKAFDNEQDLKF